MKYNMKFRKAILEGILMVAITCSLSSCTNSQRSEDLKNAEENTNTAAFDNESDIIKDTQFLVDAAEINLEEIQLGQLAHAKAIRGDVKELAIMIEEDHTKSQNDLKELAAKKAMTIPTTVSDNGKEAYDKLNNKNENEFDKEYCNMMVKGHKEAITKFERASRDCVDKEIRAWAAGTLPALRKHLDRAITCQSRSEKM
jgi:putative membrane protein